MSAFRPNGVISVTDLKAELAALCPETARLLRDAAFAVHPRVTAITLHGSRGPAGGYRPDSDVDMCLIVDTAGVTERAELAALLRAVLSTTLENWQGAIEADLASFIGDILDRPEPEIRHLCEQTIRNYDPCMSCATHSLPGQMPLEITIRDAEGNEIQTLSQYIGNICT